MNAPDRSQEVVQIVTTRAALPFQSDDARREFLLQTLIPALNQLDPGKWTYLVKTDQGNKIPADIIVWRETLEHIDVLTDAGAMWNNHGPVPVPAWVAGPVDSAPFSPLTDPQPDMGAILAQLNNISLQLKTLTEYTTNAVEVLASWAMKVAERQDRPLVGGNWRTGGFELKPKG